MSNTTTTVTQALRERKTLKARIEKAIATGIFVDIVIGEANRPDAGSHKDVDALTNALKSSFQSVVDLQARYNNIVEALVVSNATTKVTVAGKEMTVAAAIERRNSIHLEDKLIEAIGIQISRKGTVLTSKLSQLQIQIDERVKNNKTDVMNASDIAQLTANVEETMNKAYYPKIHDPIGLMELITKMRSDNILFKDELEVQLNLSNAVTKITF